MNNKNKQSGFILMYILLPFIAVAVVFGLNFGVDKIVGMGMGKSNKKTAIIGDVSLPFAQEPLPTLSETPSPTPETIVAGVATQGPVPSSAPEPTPKLKPKPTPKITPSPSPSPSVVSSSGPNGSGPTASPSATPVPTPKPNICQSTLPYRIRYVDGEFYQNDLDREKLKGIVLYAESQWESAVNADLFKYEDANLNANAIDFTNNTVVTYNDKEAGQFGITKTSDTDKNGVTDKFQMTIFREIFYLINGGSITYIGETNKNYSLEESVVTRAVMHQMGHILGIDHLPDGQIGIMATKWIPTTYKPTLSQNDKSIVKTLCK